MKNLKKRLCFLMIFGVLSNGNGMARDNVRLYRDSDLNIEFELPPGLKKKPCSHSESSTKCITFWDRDRSKSSDPAITIDVKSANLQQALSEHVLFENKDGIWVKHGRFNESRAIPITGQNWKGLEAIASCGISDEETGFHAGAGECYTAILSNGNRSAVIETDGFGSTLDAAVVISKTFRFLK